MPGRGSKRKLPKKLLDSPPIEKTSTSESKRKMHRQTKVTMCAKHIFEKSECLKIQNNLLTWYDKSQRKLPWRDIAKNEKDSNIRGYSVWVSEVMLQQTQVATVIPYFNKWIEKWPSVESLASASLEEVLQVWAGLGYYSRGRRLHEGANVVVKELNGIIPNSVDKLMKLIPGIGQYSASAIASVAFQKPVGVVDGNVIRVLSRMRILGANVTQAGVREHLWELANKIVSQERPGDFNQALMELGAVVCTPQTPNCLQCPVNEHCLAYAMVQKNSKSIDLLFSKKLASKSKSDSGPHCDEVPDIENVVDCQFCLPSSSWNKNPQVTCFPCKVEKKAARQEKVYVILIELSGQFLMVRRPEKGLLASLWEFPNLLIEENSSVNVKSDKLEIILKDFGLSTTSISNKQYIGEVVHLFSHIHSTYQVDHAVLKKSASLPESDRESRWLTAEDMKGAAISTAMKKVFALTTKVGPSSKASGSTLKRKRSCKDSTQKSIKSFFS